MEINAMMANQTYSVRQAIGVATMRKAMNQDGQTVAALLDGMQAANSKAMEQAVTPHKGRNIDVSV